MIVAAVEQGDKDWTIGVLIIAVIILIALFGGKR